MKLADLQKAKDSMPRHEEVRFYFCTQGGIPPGAPIVHTRPYAFNADEWACRACGERWASGWKLEGIEPSTSQPAIGSGGL